MNKMNIPAPFRMALPTPPLPPPVPAPPPPPPPPEAARPNLEDLSSGESEMESSDEVISCCFIAKIHKGHALVTLVHTHTHICMYVCMYVCFISIYLYVYKNKLLHSNTRALELEACLFFLATFYEIQWLVVFCLNLPLLCILIA